MTRSANDPRPVSPATLATIRLAILLGALAFGGVARYLVRQPDWTPSAGLDHTVFLYAGLGIWSVAAVGILLLRSRLGREPDPRRRVPLLVAGWALGETAALWGGVYYLLTGDPQRYFTGLLFLGVAFLLLPVRGER
ncbi:MAG TPA: hypothetical protein VHG51_08060 [Longimicrobiaceae bacterium]|nr:hypothetical protein [Longimicrobiaceae bacterium]